jgi:predicted phosphoribosyltransferase
MASVSSRAGAPADGPWLPATPDSATAEDCHGEWRIAAAGARGDRGLARQLHACTRQVPLEEARLTTARFSDRAEAGRRLATKLPRYARAGDVIALGVPRGGVVVAFEIGRALHAPLDVIVARAVHVAGHPDVTIGAVASAARWIDADGARARGLSIAAIDAACAVEHAEVARRERECRGCASALAVRRRTVIVVDDGLALNALDLALRVLRTQRPTRLVAAVPLVLRAASPSLWQHADDVVSLGLVDTLEEVAASYERDEGDLRDEVVRDLLLRAARSLARDAALVPQVTRANPNEPSR